MKQKLVSIWEWFTRPFPRLFNFLLKGMGYQLLFMAIAGLGVYLWQIFNPSVDPTTRILYQLFYFGFSYLIMLFGFSILSLFIVKLMGEVWVRLSDVSATNKKIFGTKVKPNEEDI